MPPASRLSAEARPSPHAAGCSHTPALGKSLSMMARSPRLPSTEAGHPIASRLRLERRGCPSRFRLCSLLLRCHGPVRAYQRWVQQGRVRDLTLECAESRLRPSYSRGRCRGAPKMARHTMRPRQLTSRPRGRTPNSCSRGWAPTNSLDGYLCSILHSSIEFALDPLRESVLRRELQFFSIRFDYGRFVKS